MSAEAFQASSQASRAGPLVHHLGREHRPRRAPHQLPRRVLGVRVDRGAQLLLLLDRGREPVGDEQDARLAVQKRRHRPVDELREVGALAVRVGQARGDVPPPSPELGHAELLELVERPDDAGRSEVERRDVWQRPVLEILRVGRPQLVLAERVLRPGDDRLDRPPDDALVPGPPASGSCRAGSKSSWARSLTLAPVIAAIATIAHHVSRGVRPSHRARWALSPLPGLRSPVGRLLSVVARSGPSRAVERRLPRRREVSAWYSARNGFAVVPPLELRRLRPRRRTDRRRGSLSLGARSFQRPHAEVIAPSERRARARTGTARSGGTAVGPRVAAASSGRLADHLAVLNAPRQVHLDSRREAFHMCASPAPLPRVPPGSRRRRSRGRPET